MTFKRKLKNDKIAKTIVNLEEAIRLVLKCTDESDVQQFINACDLTINSVDEKYVTLLIKYVITKLYGEVLNTVRYKDTIRWVNIKIYLKGVF